jgi:hypothetical protein
MYLGTLYMFHCIKSFSFCVIYLVKPYYHENWSLHTSIYWGYFTISSQEVSTMTLAISFDNLWYMINRKPPSWMTQVTWSTLVDCLWPGDDLLVCSGHLDHPLGQFSYFNPTEFPAPVSCTVKRLVGRVLTVYIQYFGHFAQTNLILGTWLCCFCSWFPTS